MRSSPLHVFNLSESFKHLVRPSFVLLPDRNFVRLSVSFHITRLRTRVFSYYYLHYLSTLRLTGYLNAHWDCLIWSFSRCTRRLIVFIWFPLWINFEPPDPVVLGCVSNCGVLPLRAILTSHTVLPCCSMICGPPIGAWWLNSCKFLNILRQLPTFYQ